MFNVFKIAQAEYHIRNAKFNSTHDVEGMTVQVPNILDRAVLALRAALAGRTPQAKQTRAPLNRRATVAK